MRDTLYLFSNTTTAQSKLCKPEDACKMIEKTNAVSMRVACKCIVGKCKVISELHRVRALLSIGRSLTSAKSSLPRPLGFGHARELCSDVSLARARLVRRNTVGVHIAKFRRISNERQ